MLPKKLADRLTGIALKQLSKGQSVQSKRMQQISEYFDLYNNKVFETDEEIINIPFPYFANFIDKFQSKIDNVPTLTFKLPNKKRLSEKVQAAWEQEKSPTRAGWNRKDRVEKKAALITGRAVSKVYATSLNNKYQSHYDIVDIFSFVADPTRGQLMDGNYHGETDIFKTENALKQGITSGFYDKTQVNLLFSQLQEETMSSNSEVAKNKFNRLKVLGIDVESTSYAGQKGVLLTEWIMHVDGTWYYLLFDPKTGIWVRAELLKDVMANGKSPFTSWATHYDEFSFWTKSLADDIAPTTEAMRLVLNTALENDKRRTRPMRIVEGGALVDVNELQDYIPDNVIISQAGRNPNIVTVETPEIKSTINLLEYLDNSSQAKTGVQDASIQESNAKVGIYFGQLQQEADRIGIINKEYSESYAHKGYNFFWGLKQHLTKPKQVEMLGGKGLRLQQLSSVELSDVDDVDDVLVSGGAEDDIMDAVQKERMLKTVTELASAYPDKLNPHWVIKKTLRAIDVKQDDIDEALDVEGKVDREVLDKADEAIQAVLLGRETRLVFDADIPFLHRIMDFIKSELDWVKYDSKGRIVGIDEKKKEQSERLYRFIEMHQPIVIQNFQRELRKKQFEAQAQGTPMAQGAQEKIQVPQLTERDKQQALARPFESPVGTPSGTASASQRISKTLTP